MKLKTLLVVFITLNLVALCVYGYFLIGAHHAEQAQEHDEMVKTAIVFERVGVASKKDYIKLRGFRTQVKATHSLSDADFAWLVELFNKPTLTDTQFVAGNKRMWALGPMLDANLSSVQKEQLYKLAYPMLSSMDKNSDDSDKVYGCNAMRKLKDKRAILAILPLLNDPRPIVKKRAQQALDAINAPAYIKAS